jgi:DNA-binding response OmpR family regulator
MPGNVLIVEGHRAWPVDLLAMIAAQGYTLVRIDDVRLVPFFVLAGGVRAVIVELRGLQLLGVLALQKCRQCSPVTAVVALTADASTPAVKRALEIGATALLCWPASEKVVLAAIRSGGMT